MTYLLKIKQSRIISGVVFLMMAASVHASNNAPLNHAALAEAKPETTIFGITQFGRNGDDKYIFCDDHDCQRRTAKHFYVAEAVALAPLVMPEPKIESVPLVETPKFQMTPIAKPKKKTAKKTVSKPSTNCLPAK
jgi:hypothetical protein